MPAAFMLALSGSASSAETLVERARRGDRDSLEKLLRQTAPDVVNLCRHTLRRDPDDAAQAALEKIVRKLHRFDGKRGSFRSWALAIARNECRDRMRSLKRRGERESAEVDAPSDQPSPERLALARIEAADLAEALQTLPESQRSAIALFHGSGLSYEEIADVMDVPKGTIMTWLHRGRKRLRAALEKNA
ncbi:MAG: sigma-70 family RNA polymerase sigma factor [Myxococcota bacterium]